jgi:putative membrane protein
MTAANIALCVFVGLLIVSHALILRLEAFLWETRPDLRAGLGFDGPTSREAVTLAKNQGLYNGFLALGLGLGLALLSLGQVPTAHVLVGFLTFWIAVAGVVGFLTTRPRLPGTIGFLVGQTGLAVAALACLGWAVAG